MTTTETPPGWYPERSDEAAHLRYWDGETWTDYRSADGNAIAPGPPPAQHRWRIALITLAVLAAVIVIVWFRDVSPNDEFRFALDYQERFHGLA